MADYGEGGLIQYRFSFDLHKHLRIDEPLHFNHRRGRPCISEELSVSPTYLFPFRHIRQIDPRPNDILQRSADGFQGLLNVPQSLHSLGFGISDPHQIALGVSGSGARNMNNLTYPNSS